MVLWILYTCRPPTGLTTRPRPPYQSKPPLHVQGPTTSPRPHQEGVSIPNPSRPTPDRPSDRPSVRPSVRPSHCPSEWRPSVGPSVRPSDRPTVRPSDRPTVRSSDRPTVRPTVGARGWPWGPVGGRGAPVGLPWGSRPYARSSDLQKIIQKP